MSKLKLFILLALLVPSLSFAMTTEDLVASLKKSPDVLDTKTKEALIEYQIANAAEILGGGGVLNNLGALDPLTSAHLFGAGKVLGISTESFTQNLLPGMENEDVRRLQKFLNSNGFTVSYSGVGSVGQETTYYGPATVAAVKKFQEANRSSVLAPHNLSMGNGFFLTSTRARLNESAGGSTATASTAPVTTMTHDMSMSGHTFTQNLLPGMENNEVKELQKFLNSNGFTVSYSGVGSVGQETTYYGPATVAAVKKFQEANRSEILAPHDLTVGNGFFLTSTRAKMNKIRSSSSSSSSSSSNTTTTGNTSSAGGSSNTKTYTLTVERDGDGTISATNNQTCSTDKCVFVFTHNTKVILKAEAPTGGDFVRWGGECSGSRTSCSLTMDGNQKVTAEFIEKVNSGSSSSGSSSGGSSSSSSGSGSSGSTSVPAVVNYTLTTAVSGSGKVTGSSVNCPSDCINSYTNGTEVTLTAAPNSGHTFAGWSGACSGTASTCTVTMSAARTVNASFAVIVVISEPEPTPVVGGVNKATPNAYNPSFQFCTELYNGDCEFLGLRDVRYGQEGRWVTKEYQNYFPGWDCHPDTFGTTLQAGDRCEVATTAKTGTLAAPAGVQHSMLPTIDLTKIPLGSKGSGVLSLTATSDRGNTSDVGAFRVPCVYSHMAFNDPIVYPNQSGASHLHTFFGNTGVTAYSTAALLASTGNSTCPGGIANRSSYWVPTMIDTSTDTPIAPNNALWYYKTGYGGVTPASVQIIPAGLRMIAGNSHMATAAPENDWEAQYRWHCIDSSDIHSNYGLTIPNCGVGGQVALELFFPQCWDGVNLDSADHRSHMAYPENGCPSSHPVPLPILSMNMAWPVTYSNQASNFRISSDMNGNPAGVTVHADFFEAWDTGVKTTFIQSCLNQSKDCHAYLLGDGTMLDEQR